MGEALPARGRVGGQDDCLPGAVERYHGGAFEPNGTENTDSVHPPVEVPPEESPLLVAEPDGAPRFGDGILADRPDGLESLSAGEPDREAESWPGDVPASPGHSNLKPLLLEIVQTVLLTVIIFLAVRSVIQNFKVDGASMEPTLHSGQYLLVNKLSYVHIDGAPLQVLQKSGFRDSRSGVFPFGGPQRGDIVVFRYPGLPDRDFIKRIIGLPGDTVQIDRGRVIVNGVSLEEDYIRALPSYSLPSQKVPDGSYFVLGDNRPNSSDSHIWGYVPEANLIGKAWLSYWPPDQWGIVANRGLAGN